MALKHVLLTLAVAGLVLGIPVVLATGAFSAATVEREATVNVAGDSQGLLALKDGHPGQNIVSETNEGVIRIDLSPGLNHDGTFYVGDIGSPVSDHAFSIQQQGTETVDITFEYDLTSSDPDPGTQNLLFKIYDQDSNQLATMSEQTGAVSVGGIAPGDEIYVIVQIETGGLSPGADLSGELVLRAA